MLLKMYIVRIYNKFIYILWNKPCWLISLRMETVCDALTETGWQNFLSFFGWFKRSLNQSIGSFSTNPHFALFRPDRRWDIFGNVSNHWGMVTYTFFWNNFFGSLIRARTGSVANVDAGTSPLYIKVGQISGLSKNGSWVLVDARMFFFVGHKLEHGEEDLKNWWCRYMKVGQICGSSKNGAWVVVDVCISFFGGR